MKRGRSRRSEIVTTPMKGVIVAVFLTLIPFVTHGASEIEPNNKLGFANEITAGEAVTGAIQTSGDEDWYKVTLASAGRLQCSITNPPANLRPYITLYNRHADYIYVYNYAVNDGDDVHLQYDVVEPGTYFIRVHDRDGDASADPYDFLAEFNPVVDDHEPNNELGRAFLVTGTTLTGIIFSSSDEDWFKIYVNASDTLTLTVNPPAAMRPQLTLYDPNAAYMYVYGQSVNPGDPLTLEHSVSVSGFYYIRLTDYQGLCQTEAYTLTIGGGIPGYVPSPSSVVNEVESNNQLGLANLIDLETEISGTIAVADDMDWYRLEISSSGQLTIGLAQVPANLKLRFRLHNSSGAHVLSGQATDPGEPFSLTYDVTRPDTYYLLVDDLDDAAYSAEYYGFSASLAAVADPYEPNNNYGDAGILNQLNRISAYLFKTGDHDWYRIHVSQAGELRVVLSDLPQNITPQIHLFNLSKEILAGSSGISPGTDLELVYGVPSGGDYFLRIKERDDNDEATTPYTLTVHGADFASFAPTAKIDKIDPGSIIAGDSIQFTGSGVDSDGTLTGYSWRSSIDGFLSDQAIFATTSLSMGTHTIYFKVQDNEGTWSTEVREVVYVGSSVSDEVEPNSPIGLANEIALTQPVSAKILQGGDEDFFKVYIDRPGRLHCAVSNVPNNLRLYMTLYNRHLDYLYITNYANADGDDVSLEMNVTEPGFYYLRIHDRDNDFNADFTYTLLASFEEAVDPQEPNNRMLDAHTMTGNTVEGYIFPNGDEDWFKVWVDAGSTLTAEVTHTAPNLRPYVTFYGRNREYLYVYVYAENEGDNPPQLSHTFSEAGFVYIRVHDRDGDFNWTQRFQLTLTGANPGYAPTESPASIEEEQNNMIADANLIAFDVPVSATTGVSGDEDWFKFHMPFPGVIRVELNTVPVDMRGRIRVYGDDGTQINSREATNPGDLVSFDTRVTLPGLYYVRIDDLNSNASADPYLLVVSSTSALDSYEPNNRFGDATVLNEQNRIQALIFNSGDEDWYRVTCDSGTTLQVTVAEVPEEIKPRIEIFDLSGAGLSSKMATNVGQELVHAQPILTTSDYLIRIRDVDGNAFSTIPYTLIVNGAQFNSFTPLAFIDSVTPNPALSGEAVTLDGHGDDSDGDIIGYAWRSSLDGPLSTSRVATLTDLSTGTHLIYFKVKDSDQNWSPETSTILYFGVPAPQEEEPNNEIGRANPMDFGIQVSGLMDPAGDNDYFSIHIPQPGRLTVNATNPTGSLMRTYLTMYNLDADYAYVTAYAANAGDPVGLTWDLSEPGTYFLRVHDADGRAQGQYTVTANLQMAADPYEPNHDFTRATSVPIGEVVQGYIFPNGDEDWYRVEVSDPGSLSVSLTNMPNNLRGYITMYDSNTNYLYVYQYANNDGDNVFLTYDIGSPGPYFIRIHDRDNESNSELTYSMNTAFQPAPDPYEPNNQIRYGTVLSEFPIEAYIFPSGDEDWYRLYVENGSSLQVKVENVPSNLRPYLTLYNGNAGYLYQYATTDAEGGAVTLTYAVPETGTYYVKVHDRDGDRSAANTYRLTVTGANLGFVPPDEPAALEAEPNNEFRSATLIAQGAVSGSFEANDYDWFRFQVNGPSRLTLSLTVPSTIQSEISVYDGNNSQRLVRTAENPGDGSEIVLTIDEPGTWYVRIRDVKGTVSAEDYQIVLTLDPVVDAYEPNPDFARASPIAIGAQIEATVFPASDMDWFQIEVEEPGLLRLSLSNVPQNVEARLHLYDENRSQKLFKEALNGGDPVETSYLAPGPGTYYVQVYDRNQDGYSLMPYSLNVSFVSMRDVTEPNDRFSQAASLDDGNQVVGFIYPVGDRDWYSFTVNQAGTLRIHVTQTAGIEPHLSLYNDSKGLISEKRAKNKGDLLVLTYQVQEPDLYYLLVYDENDNDYSTQPYVVTIEGGLFSTYSPIATIETITPNPAIQGQSVTLSGSGTDEDGSVVAYEWASDRDGSLGGLQVLDLSGLSPGAHRISLRVQDDEGRWSGVVTKRLYVTGEILAEAEYNNDIASANPVPLSTWVTGTILPSGDNDYYKIYLEERGIITALVDAVPPTMRPYITFYDGDGAYLYRYDYGTNPGDWVSYRFFADPGWYYVRIHDADSRAHQETYGLWLTFTPAQDPYEPNGDVRNATPVQVNGTIEDARICREGDEDWYRMEIVGRGRLTLSITGAPQSMRGYITVYDSNADYIYVYNYGYNDGDDVFLNYDVPRPGTYYVRVHDRDGRAHTEPYIFGSLFTPVPDAHEENGDLGHGTLLTQESVQGAIFPAGDQDWFKIYATEGSALSLSVTQADLSMRAQISLYDPNGNYTYVYETGNNGGDDVYLNYTTPVDGFYYICVSDANGWAHLTPYQLTVTGATPGYEPPFDPSSSEGEPNGDSVHATDIQLNTDVSGAIDPSGDQDWFRYYVNAPGIVVISHTNIPAEIVSEMWIYNQNRTQIAYRTTTNPGEANVLTMTTMEAGYYFARLADRGNDGASSQVYTLRVTHTPVVDGHEPNNNYGQATPLGQDSIQGYIFDQTDQDWYRVYVREPGILAVSLDGMPLEIRPNLSLYNENKSGVGGWLATNDGQTGEDLIQYNVLGPEFYYVRIYDEGGNSYSASPYTLRITGADFSTAPVLDPIGDRTIDETIPYGFTIFASDPDNEESLTFTAGNLPPGATFDGASRTFSWKPGRGQAGVYPGIHFEVSDGTHTDSEDVTITVNALSEPPILAPIGEKSVAAGTQLTFQISAVDPDSGEVLTYAASALPNGAVFTSTTATFTWTPSPAQVGTHPNVYFSVTDGTWTDFEYVTIMVTAPLTVPTVTTGSSSEITETTAKVSGEVTFDGGSSLTERGMAYSVSQSPTVDDGKVPAPTAEIGPFTVLLQGLTPGTTYYVRAYAMNSVGTGYGEQVTFNTLSLPPDIFVSPVSHDFGTVTVAGLSDALTLTVTNLGGANLVLGTVSITGSNASEFAIQNDACSNESIAPMGSGTLEIIFSPSSEGQKSATLTFPSNDPDTENLVVSLVGTGEAEPAIPGDLNQDGVVDLADAILVLEVSVGIDPPRMDPRADVNGDGKIDTTEAIYVLERISLGGEPAE